MKAGTGSPRDFIEDRDIQDTECTQPQVATAPHCLPLGCCTDPQSCSPAPGCHLILQHAYLPCSAQLASGWTQFHSSLTPGLWIYGSLQLQGHQNLGQHSPKADEGIETLRGPWMLGSGFHHTSGFHGTSAGMLLLRSQGSGQPWAAPCSSTSPTSGSSHLSGSWKLTLAYRLSGYPRPCSLPEVPVGGQDLQ